MEKILKKQTKEQVLNDFKRFKELDYNLEEYVPNFYEDIINLFQEDIKELERLSSSQMNKSIFINKLIFNKKNINNVDDFKEFILKNKPDVENLELYKDFDERIDYNYNSIKTDIGGRCVSLYYFDNTNNNEPIWYTTQLVIGNAYRNPFDTIQTIFHEFCHAMQAVDKLKNQEEKISEFDKTYVGYFINNLYLAETEADLFGCLLPLVKVLAINDKEIINDTIKQIEDFLFKQRLNAPFDGYFSYPILKDFLYNEEKLNELKGFIKEDGKIDILELKNFTKELTLNKQKEYYDDLFKDNEIDESIFNKKFNDREEKIEEFLEQHKESKLAKDYIEFRDKCKKHELDEVSILENKINKLQVNAKKLKVCAPDKQKYFKKCLEKERDSLQNALNDFEKETAISR